MIVCINIIDNPKPKGVRKMSEKMKWKILYILIIVFGLGLGLLGYFAFMEFIRNFPMNG